MKSVTRENLRKIFKKAKHLRLPHDVEENDFENMKFYAWIDETDNVCYMVYEYRGNLEGIRWEILRMSDAGVKTGFCEICEKHHKLDEIMLVTAKTRKIPKGINYRSRGKYICTDFIRCANDMRDSRGIDSLFHLIVDKD